MPPPRRPYSAERVRAHIQARIVVEDRGHSTPCWIWQSGINGVGYATGRPSGCAHGVMHRISYEAFVSAIPDGLVIDHLCRVRCCVNPEHLEVTTNSENIKRTWTRTRQVAATRGTGGRGCDEQRPEQGTFRTHSEGGR